MARHAKKRKINRVWIAVFSILGVILVASWVWILLYFTPVSERAEDFIKNTFTGLFVPTEKEEPTTDNTELKPGNDKQGSSDNQPDKTPGNEDKTETTEEKQDYRPKIRLMIDEGPVYDEKEDVCYYIVKAVVSGKPGPDIQFSRDDSSGGLGKDKARVDLKRNLKSYTLTATASNSVGTVMDTIVLTWGCNSPPVINEIVLSSDIIYVDSQYELTASTSDADNDIMGYNWNVEGGSLESDNEKTVVWNTPSEADDYTVTVEVADSSGNSKSKSILVYVGTKEVTETTQPPDTTPPTTEPSTTEQQESNIDLARKTEEGGYLEYGGQTLRGGKLYAGDSSNNKPCVGFISFDISNISGKTIVSATLNFGNAKSYGDPLSYLDAFWINAVNWGAEPIVQDDFNLIGTAIQSFTNSSITCSSELLKSELQDAVNNGRSRFQIRVHFSGPYTNNDEAKDGWEYSQSNINLNITVR